MTKLYSFSWPLPAENTKNVEVSIFFDDGATTWWPLSFFTKTFQITDSPASVVKKCKIDQNQQKRFQDFQTSLVFFPKATYFLSKSAVEQFLQSSLVEKRPDVVKQFKAFLTTPQQNLTVKEVRSKIVLNTGRSKTRSALPKAAKVWWRDEDLNQLCFDLLTLTKQLVIVVQMQKPMDQKTKELGLKVSKKVVQYFQQIKVEKETFSS